MSDLGGVEFGARDPAQGSDPRAPVDGTGRRGLPVDAALDPDALPRVARPSSGPPLAVLIGIVVLVGVLLFVWLNARREGRQAPSLGAIPDARAVEAPPPPLKIDAPQPLFAGPAVVGAQPSILSGPAPPIPPPVFAARAPSGLAGPAAGDLAQRARAPTVVVDLGQADAADAKLGADAASKVGQGLGAPVVPPKLSDDESFANRAQGAEVATSQTTQLGPLDHLVPQGAIITAVMETAINSDLPGYARAVVSRDVRSFDGRNVLVPRGSRLIGQYKSGEALGASRVFVIWTRVIRADGVSIQIGSPLTDPLGRAGLDGKVNRHFFQRFGGAILLSVLSAGTQALVNSTRAGTQVNIANSSDASGVATAALQRDGNTPPTITILQGAAIRVFVARDLDFSAASVTPAR